MTNEEIDRSVREDNRRRATMSAVWLVIVIGAGSFLLLFAGSDFKAVPQVFQITLLGAGLSLIPLAIGITLTLVICHEEGVRRSTLAMFLALCALTYVAAWTAAVLLTI